MKWLLDAFRLPKRRCYRCGDEGRGVGQYCDHCYKYLNDPRKYIESVIEVETLPREKADIYASGEVRDFLEIEYVSRYKGEFEREVMVMPIEEWERVQERGYL